MVWSDILTWFCLSFRKKKQHYEVQLTVIKRFRFIASGYKLDGILTISFFFIDCLFKIELIICIKLIEHSEVNEARYKFVFLCERHDLMTIYTDNFLLELEGFHFSKWENSFNSFIFRQNEKSSHDLFTTHAFFLVKLLTLCVVNKIFFSRAFYLNVLYKELMFIDRKLPWKLTTNEKFLW